MNIKDYRENELKIFVIANILVVLCLIGTITFDGVIEENSYMKLIITIINSGLFSSIIYAMVIVCDCMISNHIKKIIVFLWSPMPGETIFTDIKDKTKDLRFTTYDVIKAYSEIYDNMPSEKKSRRQYENSKWYKLLRQHESEKKVLIAHRDYLMCRDMSTTTILMIIVYIILSMVMKLITFDKKAIIYLLGVYIVCMRATRVKSKRFVKTVIACDISPKKENSENVN